ncbi:MAG: flavodoxin domain-containing protein [Candidatus Hodarchaeales archaeon]|jgi:menaquinone-dependent protoporphyrinogen IX oxidase
MDQTKILIAYGSRYGCTKEISSKIATFLEKKEGINIILLNLREIEEASWPPIERFDGIMIGTGIRVGKWTKEAKAILKGCKKNGVTKRPIIGVFISCGYASDPTHYPIAIKDFLEHKFDDIGIKPDLYDAFGGVFDFSTSSKKGKLDRKILTWGSRDLSMKIDYKNRNDYRNWTQIFEFSLKFVEIMKKF